MQRCFELAQLGSGSVAPNPMVGAVLVHNDRIIGEGYHKAFGGPHAEVDCLNSVPDHLKELIPTAQLYVSLEPCAHFGKTPPCTELILSAGIRSVVIGCEDPFPQVAGKGIHMLKSAGVEVQMSARAGAALELNKRFITFHKARRPYVILKWAQTGDGIIGHTNKEKPLKISSATTDRLVHRWRSEEAGILIGTNTALADDPQLTTRLAPGKNPVRIVVDRGLRLPHSLRLFHGSASTIVLNNIIDQAKGNVQWKKIAQEHGVRTLLDSLYELNIQSILVEGGSLLLQSFINEGLWDEARIITNKTLIVGDGVAAPTLRDQVFGSSQHSSGDTIDTYTRAISTNHNFSH